VATPPATAVDALAQEAADGYFSSLAPAKHVLLATFKWGRTPVAIPARVVAEGDRAYFQTWSMSRTAKRLRHNDWVQAAPCAALGLYRYGPWLDATARLLAGEEASQAAEKLAREHPGQHGGLTSLAGRLPGARPVHYELRPCGGAGVPGGPGHHRAPTRDVARMLPSGRPPERCPPAPAMGLGPRRG
jgi:PPOX class probable F420-dependent enzyme